MIRNSAPKWMAATMLAGAMVLTGCGESAPEGESTTASAAAEREISHAMGTTTVPADLERVVALDRGVLDSAIAVGVPVVGFTEIAGSDGIPDYFGKDGEKYAGEAELVGSLSEPSLEKIHSLDPDLILSAKVRHEELYPQLEKIAPTVFTEKTGGTWKENLELVGETAGKEDVAEEKLAEYEERAKRIGDRVREKLGENPEVSVVRFVDGPTRIYKEDTYIGVIMNDLGFERNEASTGTGFNTEISEEEIGLMDADHIFITTYADDEGLSEATKEKFRANPLWDKLDGEVHEVEDGMWMSAVGLYGANAVLDDVASTFGVDAD